jgi:dsDNA-specific endonuclease/ATPase MutS2
MVIDLHLPSYITQSKDFDPRQALQMQLDLFESELDKALVNGEFELIIIHGIGSGILKKEIHLLAKSHPHVDNCVNEYHPLYGFGSTKITFK